MTCRSKLFHTLTGCIEDNIKAEKQAARIDTKATERQKEAIKVI